MISLNTFFSRTKQLSGKERETGFWKQVMEIFWFVFEDGAYWVGKI